MDNDKVNEALRECNTLIVLRLGTKYEPARALYSNQRFIMPCSTLSQTVKVEHMLWMIAEALSWPADRLEKKFRWLGFIQGGLWADGLASIDELKKMNMPTDIDDTHLSQGGK